MSIARPRSDTSVSAGARLLDLVQVRPALLSSKFSALIEVDRCYESMRSLWERVDFTLFTTHGVEHSESIISYFGQFDHIYEWSDYEKVVFITAALIHDVGMQYNKWAVFDAGGKPLYERLGTPAPNLAWQLVRKHHIDHGAQFVDLCTDTKTSAWLGDHQLCSPTIPARDLLRHASLVAFAHSAGPLWEAMKNPQRDEYRSRPAPVGGGKLRIRLLAGILKLCDELDGTHARVARPDELWRSDLPNASRLHWLACMYTQYVDIRPIDQEDHSITILIFWQVPYKGNSVRLQKDIFRLVDRMRTESIRGTARQVNEMLSLGGESGLSLSVYVDVRQTPTERFTQNVTPQLRALLRRQDDVLDATRAATVAAKLDSSQVRDERRNNGRVRISAHVHRRRPETELERDLLTWLRSNSQEGHFKLTRGAHTDTLVHLRGLVARGELLDRMVLYVTSLVRKKRPTLLIGVGTSCIPLVTLVSMRTGVPMTFMTHILPGNLRLSGAEVSGDAQPLLEDAVPGPLLVVDDLVAEGRSSDHLVRQLKLLGVPPSRITYLILFRLSSVRMTRHRGVEYLSLCDVPHIYYQSDLTRCALCDLGLPLVEESTGWGGIR